MSRRQLLVVVAAFCALAATGCQGSSPEEGVAASIDTGGDAVRGRAVIEEFNCGSCHTIPGISGANGLVAPPLLWFARRTYVAGEVPNTPDNLAQWVRQPWSIEPKTAMPDVGLDEQQARDVVAYLYTLR